MEGNEDQNPVREANENNHYEEEFRNLPLKNLERGPAAPHIHLSGSTCGTKLAQKRNVKKEIFVKQKF